MRTADDRYVPAVHPVRGERSADSALDDSVVLMMGDRYVPAVLPVRGERSVRADSVAAGYLGNCSPADCWRRAGLPGADSRRGDRLPVVRLELVPGLAARVWPEERPSRATLEHSPDAASPVPGEERAFRGVAQAISRERQMMAEAEAALSWQLPDGLPPLAGARPRDRLCSRVLPKRKRVREARPLWPSRAWP